MGYGGARPGAGRKPKEKVVVKRVIAEAILASVDESGIWHSLIKSKDLRIRLEAMKYLTDRRDGKAPQSIQHSGPDGGPIQHQYLDNLSDEQLATVEAIVENAHAGADSSRES